MTDSEQNIARYAAQMMQAKRVSLLTLEEKALTGLLEKHGYLRPASNGFLGTITNKSMLRGSEVAPVGKDPLYISLRNDEGRGIANLR